MVVAAGTGNAGAGAAAAVAPPNWQEAVLSWHSTFDEDSFGQNEKTLEARNINKRPVGFAWEMSFVRRFLQPYFTGATTSQVKKRIIKTILCGHGGDLSRDGKDGTLSNYGGSLSKEELSYWASSGSSSGSSGSSDEGDIELYGPFWISISLCVAMGISANFPAFLKNLSKSISNSSPEHPDMLVPLVSLICLFPWLILETWILQKLCHRMGGSKPFTINFFSLLMTVGYANVIFVPSVILSSFLSIKWIWWLLASTAIWNAISLISSTTLNKVTQAIFTNSSNLMIMQQQGGESLHGSGGPGGPGGRGGRGGGGGGGGRGGGRGGGSKIVQSRNHDDSHHDYGGYGGGGGRKYYGFLGVIFLLSLTTALILCLQIIITRDTGLDSTPNIMTETNPFPEIQNFTLNNNPVPPLPANNFPPLPNDQNLGDDNQDSPIVNEHPPLKHDNPPSPIDANNIVANQEMVQVNQNH